MLEQPASKQSELLTQLFHAAIEAAHPANTLAHFLPEQRDGRAIVVGAGKGAASMALAFEKAWSGPIEGIVVTRYGHAEQCQHIEVVEASHPVPDSAGEEAATRILSLVKNLTASDTVFFLLSGGGSSLLALPAAGITLEQKRAINKGLLRCGAAIDEINCVRKHLSAIKGGRLALACRPAKMYTYAISDVPGDEPSVIASGPSVADHSTCADAINILKKYQLEVPDQVIDWLHSAESETPKQTQLPSSTSHYQLIATPKQSLDAAADRARACGINPLILGDTIEGEAREVAKVLAAIAGYIKQWDQPIKKPCVILSGGETTVTVKGRGRGGRNAEFLLALALQLKGQEGIYALAADTDGIDGCEDNAGALLTPDTYSQALNLKINMAEMLANNDGYNFFSQLNALLVTGPTRTNVNDFRAIYIE